MGLNQTNPSNEVSGQTPLSRLVSQWQLSRLSVLVFAFVFSLTAVAEAGVVAFALGESSVKRGQSIFVGDVIETGENGHVHIRFVDGALVSVRPNSELRVDEYTYVPDNPEQNRVRFTLKAGTVRSVTGEAGKTNKDAYRMNTPVSAIGIRGTDYTVSSDARRTRVVVESGGIGIAPLDDECSAEDVGVCQSSKLVELIAGESYVMEISALNTGANRPGADRTLQTPRIAQGTDLELANLSLEATVELARRADVSESSVGWAHWSNFSDVLGDLFKPTTPFLNSQWRIVSANSLFGLFMHSESVNSPRNGEVKYNLNKYEAYFVEGARIEQARLFDSSLSIDYGSREFNFSGKVASERVVDEMQLRGSLSSDGFLRGRTDDTIVSGGITSGGLGAGLLFEKTQNDTTRFVGASTWSED